MNLSPLDLVLLSLIVLGGAWGLIVGALKATGPFALLLALLTLVHAYPEVLSRFGTELPMQIFFVLLLGFIGLVVFGFVSGILHRAVLVSGLGPFNRLLGLVLGFVLGTVLAGAVVWGLEEYGAIRGRVLLHGSVLAPAVSEFFAAVMAFTTRLFPRPESGGKIPWWKRALW